MVLIGPSARTATIIVAWLMVAAIWNALAASTGGFLNRCMLAATPFPPVM